MSFNEILYRWLGMESHIAFAQTRHVYLFHVVCFEKQNTFLGFTLLHLRFYTLNIKIQQTAVEWIFLAFEIWKFSEIPLDLCGQTALWTINFTAELISLQGSNAKPKLQWALYVPGNVWCSKENITPFSNFSIQRSDTQCYPIFLIYTFRQIFDDRVR